ncbi:MAG: NAD-dependent malic enzyme [Candidatus Aenigmarchaeota archaeon]|nr:NAD-dependent malic enzyme [Candidatus Aenigmarchaeota archaeon]
MPTLKENALVYHKKGKHGKLEVRGTKPARTMKDLSLAYTPGVAEVCRAIVENPERVYDYTIKGNCIAILTNGTRVLGLGNIGPSAGLPVMEGKALIYKLLGGVDAFPVCIKADSVEEFIAVAKALEPTFGGFNLEDIRSPDCFDIERTLENELGIPVFHDDQHGTAVSVCAALINALKIIGKDFADVKIAISGAGAAGLAVTKLLNSGFGARKIVVCDSKGIIFPGRDNLTEDKNEIAILTAPKERGGLKEAMKGADVFIGLSSGGIVSSQMVISMASQPIIFALANPVPEISPEEAKKSGAYIVGTARADYPNQVNNSVAFPGIMRGLLDCNARKLNMEIKVAAARAIAGCVKKPTVNNIIPTSLDKTVAPKVAAAVVSAAQDSEVARRGIKDLKQYEAEVKKRISSG